MWETKSKTEVPGRRDKTSAIASRDRIARNNNEIEQASDREIEKSDCKSSNSEKNDD